MKILVSESHAYSLGEKLIYSLEFIIFLFIIRQIFVIIYSYHEQLIPKQKITERIIDGF